MAKVRLEYEVNTTDAKASIEALNKAVKKTDQERIASTKRRQAEEAKANEIQKQSINGLKLELAGLKKQYNSLSETQRKNSAEGRKLEANIAKLSGTIKRSNERVREQEKVNKSLLITQQKQVKSIKDLREFTNALVFQRDRLNLNTKESRKQFDLLTKQINQNNLALKKYDAQIGRSQRNVGNYAGALKLLALKFFAILAGLRLLSRGFRTLISDFIAFSSAGSELRSILNVTALEAEGLTKQAKQLGLTTASSATQVTKLQTELARLGFTINEITAATPAVQQLAIAIGGDLVQAAEVAGITIRQFGLDASETARVVDVMAKSFTTSPLNIERFQAALKFAGVDARRAGFSIEEVTAQVSTLAKAGLLGTKAGTALRKIYLELGKSGVTGAEGLNKLAKSGLTIEDAFDEVGLRAQTALLILSEGKETVDEFTKSFENAEGSAQRLAETRLDNLAGDLKLLRSAWEGLNLELSKSGGLFRSVVQSATSFVRFLTGAKTGIDQLNESIQEESRSFDNLKNALLGLKRETELTTKQSEVYNGIIEDLNEQFPDYLKNINLQTTGFEETKKILDQLNDSLLTKFAIQKQEAELNPLLNDQIDLLLKQKENTKLLTAERERLGLVEDQTLTPLQNAILLQEKRNKLSFQETLFLKVLEDEQFNVNLLLEENENKQKEIIKNYKELIQGAKDFTEAGGGGDGGDELTNEQKSAIQKRQDELAIAEEQGLEARAKKVLEFAKRDALALAQTEEEKALIREIFAIKELELAEKTQAAKDKITETQEKSDERFIKSLRDKDKNKLELLKDTFDEEIKLINELSIAETEKQELRLKSEKRFQQEKAKLIVDNIKQYTDLALDVGNSFLAMQEQNETAKIEKDKQRLEDQLDGNLISQEEYEKKLEALNKKADKEDEARRKKQKALDIISSIINTAVAVTKALPNIPLAIATGVAGAAQTAIIASQKFARGGIPEKASRGTLLKGPSHAEGGIPIEAEGNEAIINKKSTAKFLPLLSAINSHNGNGVSFSGGEGKYSGLLDKLNQGYKLGGIPKMQSGGLPNVPTSQPIDSTANLVDQIRLDRLDRTSNQAIPVVNIITSDISTSYAIEMQRKQNNLPNQGINTSELT